MGLKIVHLTPRNTGWFLVLFKPPAGVWSPRDLGGVVMPEPLGTFREVMARISAAEPDIEWTGPEWGWVRSATWTIKIDFADEDPNGLTDSVLLSLRGRGDGPVEFAFRVADALGCTVFDGRFRALADVEDAGEWRAIQRECEREAAGDDFDVNGWPLPDEDGVRRWS